MIDLVRAKADALKLGNMDMPSGAGHDAMHIARLCPAGMIFVPCERGISHNEIENATPADLAAGARVLVEVLVAWPIVDTPTVIPRRGEGPLTP